MANNQQWNTAGAVANPNVLCAMDLVDRVQLAAPGITPTALSSSIIRIALSAPTANAESYVLQRSSNGSTGWVTLDAAWDGTDFDDSGLSASAIYYYRALAQTSDPDYIDSAYSTIENEATQALQPPTQAPDFTTTKTSTSITATITNAYGATDFRVRVDAGTAEDGLTKTSLTPESTVAFSVQGYNDDGNSPWSDPVSITLDAAGTGTTDPARLFTLTRTFEGTVGNTAYGPDGFDGDAGRSTYSDEMVYQGTTSCRMQLLTTDTDTAAGGTSNGGFGNWGGRLNFPVALKQGDEVWVHFRMFFPTGFSFHSGTSTDRIKFTRLKSKTEAGGNRGMLDVYWARANETKSYMHIKEGAPLGYWKALDDPQIAHITGEWVCFNWYYYIHSDDNQAISRWWRNDQFLRELSSEYKAANLSYPTDTLDWFNIFTYWNGVVPQDQHCYMDDLIITSDRSQTVIDPGTGYPWLGN